MSEDKAAGDQPGQDTSEWDKGYSGAKVDPRDNADYTVPAQTEAAPAQADAEAAPTGAPDGAPDLSPEGDQDAAPDGTTAADVGEAANEPQPVGPGAEADTTTVSTDAPTGDGGEV